MAQVFTQKQFNWLTRFSALCVALMDAADELSVLCTEFSNDQYGNGAANALTDSSVQNYLPAATAALVFSAEGSLANANAILATIASSRQSLEMMRP